MKRYAVRHRCTPDEFLGGSRGHDYQTGTAGYHIVERVKARLWLRKADAVKAAKAMGSAQVIEVDLTFLTLSGVTQVCE